jgi:iron complex outermembrane receptor protein
VLNGKTNITLPGGDVAWAAGVQYRRTYFKADYNDISNAADQSVRQHPGLRGDHLHRLDSATAPSCSWASATPADNQSDVMAGFGELSVPISDDLQAQFAARYEKYGNGIGSTFNPKASLRWQALPWLAFRGSAGSTFRGPPDPQTTTTSVTSLQGILGVFRAVDIFGNPNLKPEKAKTYNFGTAVQRRRFQGQHRLLLLRLQKPDRRRAGGRHGQRALSERRGRREQLRRPGLCGPGFALHLQRRLRHPDHQHRPPAHQLHQRRAG